MTELKNTERELYLFRMRLFFIGAFALVCFILLMSRFVWLQIVKHNEYALQADENRISIVPVVPNRGLILDRNGVILARNFSAYTLEITPSKITNDLDVVIDELSLLIDIQPKHRKQFRKLIEESKSFESIPIRTKLTDEEVARFTAQRFRFPGVDIQARLFRQYPLSDVASHVIGYIGRISQKDAEIIDDSDDSANYNGTSYIGKEGLEKSYEKLLHGTTGFEEVEVSAGGRAVRTLSRTAPTSGKNLILSVDIELQKVIEDAFGDRRGALVAIEPATGDVLAFVSKPTYDPNLFVEGIDQQSWNDLNTSEDKPLLNRPLTGAYPPGSTYKPFMALAALELGKRTTTQAIADQGYFVFGNHRFNDDKVGGHGMVDMYRSIVQSCDTYYYMLANDLGVDTMHDFMMPFGFGQITGIDLEHERKGLLPSTAWKRSAFKKPAQQRWVLGDTISLGIGQGQNTFTPLQMAHAVATLANDGVVMKPHLVKIVEDAQTRVRTLTVPKESFRIPLKQENIDFVKQAMVGVTREGTSRSVFLNAEYASGGKTGTAQVVGIKKGEKYDARRVAERHKDHSLYIAFAPADHPKIAIAIIVENGGFGSDAAAPIVKKAFDYYLLGKRPQDKDKTPALKPDPALYRTDEDIKAAAEMSGEPKPGGETEGNKD
ncbi:penicillin-binding protein 2 [Undibacterium sp. RTI2.1]|uniref:penicillin-binding protein 2 n=1 Tax=unclassified Undibacterium TaxID=2630295 RepID=UPI002AB57F9D|nr:MULTISPECIES: penicillin-binding protein 2 [unclassified Undibacterium]MDY7539975.1 penicillin-binding protein 2 [Undibacterium sp. 5I1]MEB0032723.1 penicillin-binding protein 2 [Undibacterium sp. RTI2.1]MEB0116487.1 penicillin-binding protein 2 [Undibacterium sp. RTI2.2]MEB0232733.1 penicillin-binding protein 2 [Undibacterium sp. 10I3]MEB0257281.1 penicillin-binding protein 2 [Undibacterium sp. 5I1]